MTSNFLTGQLLTAAELNLSFPIVNVMLPPFNAKCDNSNDDAAAIQKAVDSLDNSYTGAILIPGLSAISTAPVCRNLSIRFMGLGWGNSSSPNKGSGLRWIGPAGQPMLDIRNCWGTSVHSLRFIGNVANPPSEYIKFTQDATPGFGNFPWTSTGAVNTAQKLALEDLWFGTMFGTDPVSDGFGGPVNLSTNGITFAGTLNGDNCSIRNVTIAGCAAYGIDCQNPQAGLLTLHGLQLLFTNVGIRTVCRITGTTINFEASAAWDIEIGDGGWVDIRSVASEQAPKHVKFTGASGKYSLKNSTLQITNKITAGDPKFFDASSGAGTHAVSMDLEHVKWDQGTTPGATPVISAFNQNGGTSLDYLRIEGGNLNENNLDLGSVVWTNDGRTIIFKPAPTDLTPVVPRDEQFLSWDIPEDRSYQSWRNDFTGKLNNFGGPFNVRRLIAPVNVAAVASLGSGGTTYTYQVVAKTYDGTTIASANATCTNGTLGVGNHNTITWNQCLGAQAYDIYGRIGGSIGLLATVTWKSLFNSSGVFAGFTYTDTGTPAPGAAAPTKNTTGNVTVEGALFLPGLIKVAVPTNANAATAGVLLNGLYASTADPAIVYVRTA